MAGYIKIFQETGISTINVDKVCKDWNDRFYISTWINDAEEKYTFIVNGKRKNVRLCKTEISKKQALQIVSKLNLIHVKSSAFKSAGTYYTNSFINSEIQRLTRIKKENELLFIKNAIHSFEYSIKTAKINM